jgi:predicted deacetylase
MTARLVVSLSGISARALEACADLSAELAHRGVPLSLLFAPRAGGSGVAEWVRQRQAAGDALLLHGFDHVAPPSARLVALGRRAEFATLPAHEAGLRLTAAVLALGRVGLASDSFAPPRWLASPGTVTALHRMGFALCADATGVRDLHDGTVHRGRILGFGQGEATDSWRCYALVLGAGRQARRGGLVRLAADTGDLARPGPRQALLDAVDLALHHGAEGVTYPALLGAPLRRAA